jgi:hypothetical protein
MGPSGFKNPKDPKAPFGFFTLEDVTDRLSRNVDNYHYSLRNNTEELCSH